MALYIGLMSGTSLDGVDGVLAEWPDDSGTASGLRMLAHHHAGFGEPLRDELLRLNRSGADELHRAALAANALVRSYASSAASLLEACGRQASEVRAIGAHGQTVRHRPQAFDGSGYTLQLMNGALLAELTGVDVVCDFRSRDVAAGGQGAPLVPAFHAAAFGTAGRDIAILNLGGIANLTLLRADSTVGGFDCGPGNVLLDLWCRRHLGVPYDDAGRWAATGRVDAALLGRLLAEPYLAAPPPKSTGRDLFNAEWLAAALGADGARLRPEDVQATLTEFTARAAAEGLGRHAPALTELLLCGGGARNADLVGRLRAALPACRIDATDARGVPAEQVEALAFAWLARAFVERRPGNLPAVTGARGPRVLGALYPA